nr:DUF456 family protein [Nocardioides perillae]
MVLLVGVVGVVVPLLPGTALVGLGVLGWAVLTGGATAWTVAAVAVALLLVGAVVKYVVPGRRLTAAGVPTRTLAWGGAAAVVGFFVVPVVGLVVGFVLGVYAAEHRRVGPRAAWPSTTAALRAVGLALLVELAAALAAVATWAVGVALT